MTDAPPPQQPTETWPPGWYPDPENPQATQRYWDGTTWTDNRAPFAQVGGTEHRPETSAGGLGVAGYVLAIVFPIVGFIIGIVMTVQSKRYGNHGIGVLLTSVAAFAIWFAIWDAQQPTAFRY